LSAFAKKKSAMTSKVYLVRHAESAHNVSKDFNHRDPPLTALGISQAAQLVNSFPNPASIGVIFTSPLKRAIQTTLAAFPHILDNQYFAGRDEGVENGARLIIDPDLQERSDLPCDTGSETAALQDQFPQLDFGDLGETWLRKNGDFAVDDNSVQQRALRVSSRLGVLAAELERAGEPKKDIAVVTHGVFMKFLSQDQSIDLPKAGWKAFKAVKIDETGSALVPYA
jgi:broad specificity phosphatase PhoE